jgi:hypothetical protein
MPPGRHHVVQNIFSCHAGLVGAKGWRYAGLIVAAILGCLACSGSVPNNEQMARSAIVGGSEVQTGAWPMVVWLDNGCSGVLLGEQLVAFAAHCGDQATAIWLGERLTVNVDDDAGTASVTSGAGARRIAVSSCQINPAWQLGAATDIGFCELAQPAIDASQLIYPAQGCIRADFAPGDSATLVGFGRTGADDAPGIKRSTQVTVSAVGPTLQLGDASHGTCAGDSGGPAFIRVGEGSQSEWGLAGILSAGIEGQVCGLGYYPDLSESVPWLEAASGTDVSPCFNALGAWSPSARCVYPNIDEDGTVLATPAVPDSSCGAAYASSSEYTPGGGCASSGQTPRHGGAALLGTLAIAVGIRRARCATHVTDRRSRRRRPRRP